MFKFDFDLSDDEDNTAQPAQTGTRVEPVAETSSAGAARYRSYTLKEMVSKLPRAISFSAYPASTTPIPLYRRDLYDARFQVLDEGSSNHDQINGDGLGGPGGEARDGENGDYVDAATDLIPGTYEGGLKTWEGGMDLVELCGDMDREIEGGLGEWLAGKRVLEVGCGTAAPTCFLLNRLMAGAPPTTSRSATIFHLQDYNLSVLHLVTLPNLVLAALPPSHLAEAGGAELDIDDETLDLFFARLEAYGVEIRFSSGSWDGLADDLQREGRYDLVLTAETIYQTQSVPSLLRVLRAASTGDASGSAVVTPTPQIGGMQLDAGETLTLVAAKVIYFGVGGDLHDFRERVARAGGRLDEVKSWSSGVGRQVLQLRWNSEIKDAGK